MVLQNILIEVIHRLFLRVFRLFRNFRLFRICLVVTI
jgi:hypothetical protein